MEKCEETGNYLIDDSRLMSEEGDIHTIQDFLRAYQRVSVILKDWNWMKKNWIHRA